MSEVRDGRFGRLSPNGQHLACGAVQVSVDGVVVGPGTTPVWLDDGSILYTRQPDGALMRFDLGFAPSEIRPAAHEPSSLCVARDPIYPTHFAWRERDGLHTNLGRHVPLMFRPTFAGADLCWCLDTGATADLYREGRLVARTVHDVRGELDGRLCFVQVDGAEQWTCIEHPDGRVASWRLAGAQEYRPHVIDWRGEEWVLSHTRDERLLLRTGNNGIVVATGATFEPDCAVLPDGRVRVIWADAAGVSRERVIDVTEPQVDLRKTHAQAVDPFPPGRGWTRRDDVTEIPILPFLIGGPDGFSRDGAHVPLDGVALYSHWMQSRYVDETVAQVTKPNGHTTFTIDVLDWTIGIAYDGTNEIDGGYRLVNEGELDTAPLWTMTMPVGEARRRETPVEILTLRTLARRAVICRTWVEAVYDGPAIGDVPAGRYAVLGYTFDIRGDGIDGDPRGVIEYTICREDFGPVAWFEYHRRLGTWRRWFGVRNVPRHPDPTPQFAHALPTAPSAPPVQPPTPEPPPVTPPTVPTLPSLLTLRSAHGRYLCAEEGGGGAVVADREQAGPWETFEVVGGVAPNTIALRCHDGVHYLCAEDGGGGVLVANRTAVGPWESWTVERHGDGLVLRSHAGFLICAEDDYSVEVNRFDIGPWETWTPTKVDSGTVPPPHDDGVPSVSRLVGPLRIAADRSAFIDDTGPVLLVFCHAGDFLSRWVRDPAGVRAELDAIAAAGYDGVRTWTVLGGSSYWEGREVGPMYQADFFDHVSAFAAALRSRGLRWLVSQGDMLRLRQTTSERQTFMRALAGRLDLELVAGVDAGNEALWNGEDDPAKMRAAVDAFRAVLPCAVWSLTSPGSEEKSDLDTFSGAVFDVHGYRDARSWDKVRHIFSIGYEGKPSARLGIQSEPFGYGDLVSASANKDELTSGVLALACAVSLLSRQAWVYFSGPGVKSDAGQRLQDMPGFRETCAMRDALPRDLMTFGALVHGGASQRGRRVFAVPSDDPTRADHAIHADGRFVMAAYGPSWKGVYQERTCQIEKRIDCGEAGYVVVGRV